MSQPLRPAIYGPWDSFIKTMRLTLPFAAVILGTITLLWPFLNDHEVNFTLSTDDVAKGGSSVHMTNLRYVGTDITDRLFTLEAASGYQDDPNTPRIKLSDIKAEMLLDNDGPAIATARTGLYRSKDSTLSLVGGVELETGNGYTLRVAGAEIDLKKHIAIGQGSVKASSKLGVLSASQFEVRINEQEGHFEGGVHIHIIPHRPTH